MAMLMGGKIEQTGHPAELYNRPANLRVARFLMLQNLYPGRTGARNDDGLQWLELAGTRFIADPDSRFPEGSPVVVGIRPEEVILIRPDRPSELEDEPNLLAGKVAGWVDLGHYRLVRVRAGAFELDSWLNIRAAREFPMEEGAEIQFRIRPQSFCLLPPDE
jgi:ABC-type Fe3+/spermidine/putrescine transport system ATPase subunit